MLKRCQCPSVFQDTRYGKGMRVHTVSKVQLLTCTVCGRGQRSSARSRSDYRDLEVMAKQLGVYFA